MIREGLGSTVNGYSIAVLINCQYQLMRIYIQIILKYISVQNHCTKSSESALKAYIREADKNVLYGNKKYSGA